jgi:hypothetical protein
MLIQVNYTDERYDYVKDFMLDALIQSGKVAQFKRSSGWVRVGADPIRSKQAGDAYNGSDRRSH